MGRSANYKSPSTIRRILARLINHLHKIILQTSNCHEPFNLLTCLPSTSYIPRTTDNNPQPEPSKPFTLSNFLETKRQIDEEYEEKHKAECAKYLLSLRKLLEKPGSFYIVILSIYKFE
jgi:hypothetical protein